MGAFNEGGKGRRIGTESAYFLLGGTLRTLMALATVPVMVRTIGIEQFGLWTLAASVLGLGLLADVGMSAAVTYFVAQESRSSEESRKNQLLSTSLAFVTVVGSALSLAGILWTPAIVGLLTKDAVSGDAIGLFRMTALTLVPRLWQQWACAVESAHLFFRFQNCVETAAALGGQAGVLLIVVVSESLSAAAAWLLLVSLLAVFAHWRLVRVACRSGLGSSRPSPRTLVALLSYGFPQLIASSGSVLFSYGARLVVGVRFGAEAAGVFSGVTAIAAKINELSAVPIRVLPPLVAQAWGSGNGERIRRLYRGGQRLCGALILCLSIPILVLSEPIAQVVFGPGLAATTTPLLRAAVMTYALYSLNAGGFFVALGLGLSVWTALFTIAGAGVTLGALLMIPATFGPVGAIAATGGFALTLGINVLIGRRIGLTNGESARLLLLPAGTLAAWSALSSLVAGVAAGFVELTIVVLGALVTMLGIALWLRDFVSMRLESEVTTDSERRQA